ncbi:MAG: methyl-accepting chemotaxis protein [Planctomycetota bacterium]
MSSNAATLEASSTDLTPTLTAAQRASTENKVAPSQSGVTGMVQELSTALESAIAEIHSVNSETKVLALNARIEAARAGSYGAAFSVVAEEMQTLSDKTSLIAEDMASRTRDKTSQLMELIDTSVRGTRLSDLALVNIDLIDRNLYERTCDVRWWATDGSLVDALTSETTDAFQFASKRLGVILDAYTVYHDLVLCGSDGTVVANGRPHRFRSVGENQSRAEWFQQSLSSHSGDEYGFQSAHVSPLVDSQPALAYSCAVRSNGDSHGQPLGVLGILFNWSGLANPILNSIPVADEEKGTTLAFIVNESGQVLASNRDHRIGDALSLPQFDRVRTRAKGFFTGDFEEQRYCIGHAKAPGFETYSTGWYSLVMQPSNV